MSDVRLPSDLFHDRRIRRLTPAARWLWVAICAAAQTSPEPGRLFVAPGQAMNDDDLTDWAAMKPAEVRKGLHALVDLGLLAADRGVWKVVGWDDQPDDLA